MTEKPLDAVDYLAEIAEGPTYRADCAEWLLSRLRAGRELDDLRHDAGDPCCRELAAEALARVGGVRPPKEGTG